MPTSVIAKSHLRVQELRAWVAKSLRAGVADTSGKL